MPIINQRWPRDLSPETCTFGRTRNDVRQTSPVSRFSTVIRQGRPLWSAQISWTMPNTDKLAKLRYWLENLDGFAGSAQIWDFASPYPYGLQLSAGSGEPERIFWTYLANQLPWTWNGVPSHWTLDATVIAAAASAGATSVAISGLQASTLAWVQGQYVQIGRRLYVAASTATSDGSGNATLTLSTPLVSAIGPGTPTRLVEAACEMELADQNFSANATAGAGFVSVSATFIETVADKS